jgi:AraC-like DNA-binding protein
MIQSGQPSIQLVEFSSRRHVELPVEVLERSEVIERVAATRLSMPERPSFDELILMHSAGGSHIVDFDEIPARPGRMLWVRPGQVQAWNTSSSFEATLVLSRPTAPAVDAWFPGDRAFCDLGEDGLTLASVLVESLRRQQGSFDGGRPQVRLMIALFTTLTAVFDQATPDRSDQRLPEAYLAYRRSIETDLAWSHDVTDHAQRLGYSARTISRACDQVTGQSAKRVLTDRLVLEGKRLLVHTDLTAAAIAGELGFSEPTNFNKFFLRNTASTPAAFRRSHRGRTD